MKRQVSNTVTNKNTRRYYFFIVVFLFVASGKSTAQGGFKASRNLFREKLIVITDKSFYVTGEIIWLKVHALNNFNRRPDSTSKVAYVELLSTDNKPVLQAKIQLIDGVGNGSLQLPTSLNSGTYLLRGYTAWMQNFSADGFFSTTLGIVNPFKSAQFESKLKPDAAKYNIRFFPEGGTLISGLENELAFEITGTDGRGVNATGVIVDENNNTVVSFSTLKFGMGSFNFTPVPGKHYHAVVTSSNVAFTTDLPEQQPGILLHLDDGDARNLSISVRSQPSLSNGTVSLLIENAHDTPSLRPILLQNGEASFSIDKTQLPEGVTSFTVLDSDHRPVGTRLYFKRPVQRSTDAFTDKQVYAKRDKITVMLNNTLDTQTNYSLSVYLVDSLQNPGRNPISTYLWLGSSLKGFIESPEYYFTDDKDVAAATDNLMLTQGSKGFIDRDTMVAGSSNHLPEFEGHIITGKVVSKKTGEPGRHITTYLSVPGQSFRLAVAVSNEQGIVRFNVPEFTGSDEIVVQTNQTIDSNYRVEILNPFSDKFTDVKTLSLSINEDIKKQLLQHSISSQVQNTYANGEQNQFFMDPDDSIPFFGDPDRRYFLDDYTRFTTMEEVLREYVPEVAPRKRQDSFHFMVANRNGAFFDENPLVLADGVPFFNMDTVIAFDPLKIKSLSVINRKYYYGPLTLYGIVSYATYKGDLDGINLDPNSLVMEYDGMQLQRKFYSPTYETEAGQRSRLPDFRNTLCWMPDVKLNAHEQKQLSFYSSDIAGNYEIVLQGFTSDGKAVTKTLAFQVK